MTDFCILIRDANLKRVRTYLEVDCSPFQDRTFVAWTLSSHNLPTDRARELWKPSK